MPPRFQDLLGLLESTMIDLHRQGKRLVIIVDEAHFLSSEALHVLRTLSNLESPQQKLCTCLLFAEERFLRRLQHPVHSSLATRIYHRISLRPLSEQETAQYLNFRLLVAGGRPELFDDEARGAIYAAAGGICREVNRLAYLALDAAWRQGRESIGADLVESTVNEPSPTGQPPGPKTAIRAGSVRDPFGLILGERDRAAVQDSGANRSPGAGRGD